MSCSRTDAGVPATDCVDAGSGTQAAECYPGPGQALPLAAAHKTQAGSQAEPGPLRQLSHECWLPMPHMLCQTHYVCGAQHVAALLCTCTHLDLGLQEFMNHHHHPDAELVLYHLVKSPQSLSLSATQDCRWVQSIYSLLGRAACKVLQRRRLQRNAQSGCEASHRGIASQAVCRICP